MNWFHQLDESRDPVSACAGVRVMGPTSISWDRGAMASMWMMRMGMADVRDARPGVKTVRECGMRWECAYL